MTITPRSNWTQVHRLARQARLAGVRRQRLTLRLSAEESTALADVLEAALQMMSAVLGHRGVDVSEPASEELALLAAEGGGFTWLADEPDLYTDDDLEERFEWPRKLSAEQ